MGRLLEVSVINGYLESLAYTYRANDLKSHIALITSLLDYLDITGDNIEKKAQATLALLDYCVGRASDKYVKIASYYVRTLVKELTEAKNES